MTEPVTGASASSTSDVIVAVLSDRDVVAQLDPSHETLLAARLVIDEALGIQAGWDTTSPIACPIDGPGPPAPPSPRAHRRGARGPGMHCTRNVRRSET